LSKHFLNDTIEQASFEETHACMCIYIYVCVYADFFKCIYAQKSIYILHIYIYMLKFFTQL
jgi:hypothetical protein